MTVTNRGGDDFRRTRGAVRDQDLNRTAPGDFVGGGAEFLTRNGLPLQNRNGAGGHEQLRNGDAFRCRATRTITKVKNQLPNSLLVRLLQLLAKFSGNPDIQSFEVNIRNVVDFCNVYMRDRNHGALNV